MLHGKIFISTVSNVKSFELRKIFEPLGATMIDFPMTEIEELDLTAEAEKILMKMDEYQWIIFTSANGVRYFHRRLSKTLKLASIPSHVKIAVVGPKTALELQNTGRTANYTGTGGTAESLVNELIENGLVQNCRVLLPLGNLAPDSAPARLSAFADVTRINIYKTVKANLSDETPIERIKNNLYDLILFTSPSSVINFAETLGPELMTRQLRSASIGDVTSRAARQYGLRCLVTAATSTYEGLASEIMNYYKTKN